MATPHGGRFYHTFTKRSAEKVFDINIPAGHKVLCGGVRAHGATGILSSFYNVEQGSWVVHHAPIDDGASVVLQVVTLVDPDDRYDVAVSVASLTDGMMPDEIESLTRRTEVYERHSGPMNLVSSSSTITTTTLPPSAKPVVQKPGQRHHCRPNRRNIVSLICPVVEGYTLTGGGFVSGYPVLASSVERWGPRNDGCSLLLPNELSSDDSFAVVRTTTTKAITDVHCSDSLDASLRCVPHALNGSPREDGESARWCVVAAESLSLTCYAIGICPRPLAKAVIPRGMNIMPVVSLGPDSISNDDVAAVKVFHRSGGRWGIELPPPHRKFYFSFGSSCAPNPVMLSTFYR